MALCRPDLVMGEVVRRLHLRSGKSMLFDFSFRRYGSDGFPSKLL